MLKHATISRTKRAQQALVSQWDEDQESRSLQLKSSPDNSLQNLLDGIENGSSVPRINNDTMPESESSQLVDNWLASVRAPAMGSNSAISCSSSPTPSLRFNSMSRLGSLSSAPSSVFSSPSKTNPTGATPPPTTRCSSESMIKIYAQTLSQEVEYMTLHVNAQTKSRQVIRTLLRKFRLKHRDPNLFFIILERWIRKDGLKCKSVMVLSDDACPLQLQQCCSSPPHNDIKFILEMRPGALVKIFCQDVCPNTKYKCLSLARQTTAEETIELMLNCLESSNATLANTAHRLHNHHRQASSPDSTDSSSSSSSITSSSSGIESDLTTNLAFCHGPYCLVIERTDRMAAGTHKRTLESEEPVVDVFQNMLDELNESSTQTTTISPPPQTPQSASLVIKLQKSIAISRPSRPLPPIPLTRTIHSNGAHKLASQIVSTNGSTAIATLATIATIPAARPALDTRDSASPAGPTNAVPSRPKPAERTSVFSGNRRRYDPAQLAEDLNHLDLPEHRSEDEQPDYTSRDQ